MIRALPALAAALVLVTAAPAAASHSQPPLDRGILKSLWKPIGFHAPGTPIPMPATPPPADANGTYNPSGNWNAYDTNVFESLNFPGRQAGDETDNDPPGSGDPRFGYCPPTNDPRYQPQGKCLNHALEWMKHYEAAMKQIITDFGGVVHRYEFENAGSGTGGDPAPLPAGLSSPPGKTYNIAGVVPGADHPEQEIIVSGHWDFTDAAQAAAWDSSEGHAEVIRMAKIMTDYWRATGTRPSVTVKFLPWAAEESGSLGSEDYVTRHLGPDIAATRVRGYFNVDPCAGAYPAFYHGNPAEQVPMVMQLSDPADADQPDVMDTFNKRAIRVADEFWADIDDTVIAAPATPQPVFTDADRDMLVVALGGLAAFSSDYGNFEDVGVPILNLFPDMFGPHADGTPASAEGAATIHTPRDNLQTLNQLTSPDQTGLTASDGWMKGMELCAHLQSRNMLQPEMGGAQTSDPEPVAYFEALPWRIEFPKGKLMTLDAAGSYQYAQLATRSLVPEADLQFKWDFGDKSPAAYGKKVQHAFRDEGTYQVKLTVTNRSTHQSDSMTTPVVIGSENAGTDTDPSNQTQDPGLKAKGSVVSEQCNTGFDSVSVAPAARGLRFTGTTRSTGATRGFVAEVFQVSNGRRAIKPRLVASFNVEGSHTWDGKPRSGNLPRGYYYARVTARGTGTRPDVRSFGFVRTSRFKRTKPFQRPDLCGAITLFRLDAPAFGGKRRLSIAFALGKKGRATVEVFRGRKRVKRFTKRVRTGNTLQKVSLSPRGLRRGQYRIVLRAGRKRATVYAQKL